jgi:uncharacterized membrane protein
MLQSFPQAALLAFPSSLLTAAGYAALLVKIASSLTACLRSWIQLIA